MTSSLKRAYSSSTSESTRASSDVAVSPLDGFGELDDLRFRGFVDSSASSPLSVGNLSLSLASRSLYKL